MYYNGILRKPLLLCTHTLSMGGIFVFRLKLKTLVALIQICIIMECKVFVFDIIGELSRLLRTCKIPNLFNSCTTVKPV